MSLPHDPLALSVPHQQTIFEITPSVTTDISPDLILLHEDQAELITMDPVFLSDVPIFGDHNVRQIEIRTPGADGKLRSEFRDGKVLQRRGPHPTFVRLGDGIVPRDEITKPSDKLNIKPLMVQIITTVTYERGVVQQDHLDVFFFIMNRVLEQYRKTGIASGFVSFTRQDVLKAMERRASGRDYKMIDEAVEALAGLKVKKFYMPPSDEPGAARMPMRTELLSDLIVSATTDIGPQSPLGGPRQMAITVEVHPAMVRSMCGQSNTREHSLKHLSWTNNMKQGTKLKRQLDRALRSRLDRGPVRMPLVELARDVIGFPQSDLDPAFPVRWRKRRAQIVKVLREWEATGLIEDVQIFIQRRSLKKTEDLAQQESPEGEASHSVLLKDEHNTEVTVELFPTHEHKEWISCRAGPEIYQENRNTRRKFAREILEATVSDKSQIAKIFEAFTAEAIVDVGHRRLRTILDVVGDRQVRLPTTAWLSATFPKPRRDQLVYWTTDLELYRLEKALAGEQVERRDASFAERRDAVVLSRMTEVRKRVNLLEKTEGEPDYAGELRTTFDMVINRIIAKRSLSRSILNEADRMLDDKLAREWEQVHRLAGDVALRVFGSIKWSEAVEDQVNAKLPPLGSPIPPALFRDAVGRFKQAFQVTREMMLPEKHAWEQHIGSILNRRLLELAIEAGMLEERGGP